jgi:hypothetical protein
MNERVTTGSDSVHFTSSIRSIPARHLFVYMRIVMTKIVDADLFRTKQAARSTSGTGGGNMDDVLRRLGVVESLVSQTREDVSAIKAAFAHLATKADLNDLKADVSAIKATLPHLATQTEINGVRSDLHALEAKLIRWLVGTLIAAVSAAFAVAKFVN